MKDEDFKELMDNIPSYLSRVFDFTETQYNLFVKMSKGICTHMSISIAKQMGTKNILQGLVELFQNNKTLRSFSFALSKNNPLIYENEWKAVAEAIIDNTTLEECRFNIVPIPGHILASIIQNNTALTNLTLGFDPFFRWDKEAILAFSKSLIANKTLRGLSIKIYGWPPSAVDVLAEAIKNNISLRFFHLSLSDTNHMDIKAYQQLANSFKLNTRLIHLDLVLKGSNFLLEVIKNLKDNCMLEILSLSTLENKDVIEIADLIKTSKRLIKINLLCEDVEKTGLLALADSFANNGSILDVYMDFQSTDDDNRPDRSAASKLMMSMVKNNILKRITLKACRGFLMEETDELSTCFNKNNVLEKLELGCIGFNDKTMATLAPQLKNGIRLRELSLQHVGTNNEVLIALSQMLADNTVLEKLKLKENESDFDDSCAEALSEMLKRNKTLTFVSLDLLTDKFTRLGFSSLVNVIVHNSTLIEFHIAELIRNWQESEWANTNRQLNNALRNNKCLVSLGLYHSDAESNKLLERNKKIQHNLNSNWSALSILLAFNRANQGHAFENSSIPLIPNILQLSEEGPKENVKMPKKEGIINLDKVQMTHYFLAHLAQNAPTLSLPRKRGRGLECQASFR